jgi:hypothetical protein
MRADLTGEEIRNLEERKEKFKLEERQRAAKAGTKVLALLVQNHKY